MAVTASLDPITEGFPAELARRVRLTVSCDDCAVLPKVPNAGAIEQVDGQRVQVMHNGVRIEEGCYYGAWMTEIIRCLRGHHEPQEELVVARIMERLRSTVRSDPTAIELGSFWAYYLLWLLHELPEARVLAMEPDPIHLEVGRRNFALNGRTGRFLHGGIGPEPGTTLRFTAESDARVHEVLQYDLGALMRAGDFDRVDLLLCDVQGGEQWFFPQAAELLRAGAVRFAVVSTHHHSISGDPLTHQKLVAFFRDLGAHLICEHTVGESFSGDGLIAVAFDPADRDLTVEVSRARQGDSLFGDLEHDLAAAMGRYHWQDEQLAALEHELAAVRAALADEREHRAGGWAERVTAASARRRLPRRPTSG